MLDGAGPLDLAERSVNYQELVAGHDPGEQNGHCLAVLPARGVDGNEGAKMNQFSEFARDRDFDNGHGVAPLLGGRMRASGAAPRSGTRTSTGPVGALPPSG